MKKYTKSISFFTILFTSLFFLFNPLSNPKAVDCSDTNMGGDYTVNTSCAFSSDNTTTTVADSSTNANAGTPTGTTIVSGKYGSARSFNGTGDYISVPDNASLNFGTESFSVSYWLNFNVGVTQERWSIGKGNPYLANGPAWAIANWSTGNPVTPVNLHFSDGTSVTTSSFGSLNRGTWYHLAFVADRSSNLIKTYLNGQFVAQSDITGYGSTTNTDALLIGAGASTGNVSDCLIDDVRIYNYARSETQINEDMDNGSITGSPSVGWWRMDDGYISGVDDGNLIILTDKTLTINEGQTIVWNPGKSITVEGTIVINTAAQLKQGYIWIADSDGDGLYYDSTQVIADSQPTGYVRRKDIIGSVYGDGSDGSVTFNTNTNLNTTAVSAGRSDPDTIAHSVSAIGTNTATLEASHASSAIGWWKMDESSGASAVDSSGNGYTGTATGTTIVSGKFGNARSLNGSSDYVKTLAVAGPGTANQPYTIQAWVKINAGETDGNIVHMSAGSDGLSWCLPPLALVGGKFRAQSWSGSSSIALGTTTVQADTWYHVATTWNSSDGLKIYVNGIPETTTPQAIYSASGTSNYLWFGFTPNGCSLDAGWLNGTVDDVRVYNTANTQSKIQSDMNFEVNGFAAGDNILLVNLQGDSTNYGNVGNYELLKVDSVAENIITFTTDVRNIYGATTSNSVLTGQKIIVQRVPQYSNVTINNEVTVNTNTWDGTKGGVLAMMANGTLTLNSGVYGGGTIDMSEKGYRGALNIYAQGEQGESYKGLGSANTQTANLGAGGGGVVTSDNVGGGGGGSYGAVGTAGKHGSSSYIGQPGSNGGAVGATYGTTVLDKLYMGSGGGSGSYSDNGVADGGIGGGIVLVNAATLSLAGSIKSNGENGEAGDRSGDNRAGGGGGGGGGSVKITGSSVTLGSNLATATGGTGGGGCYLSCDWSGGGNGGSGRIAVYYLNSLSGTTTPAAYSSQVSDAGIGVYLAEVGKATPNKFFDALAHSFTSLLQ